MTKKLLPPLLAALVLIIVLPISTNGRSFYNGISGLMFCDSADGCRHEIGHMMDADLGHPSRSIAFADAVRIYLSVQCDEYTNVIYTQAGLFEYSDAYHVWGVERFSSPQEELYASLFAYAGSVDALPAIFRPFYSADLKYQNLYNCLTASRVAWCGRSLHIEDRR